MKRSVIPTVVIMICFSFMALSSYSAIPSAVDIRAANVASFDQPKNIVWRAMVEFLASTNIQPKMLDSASGLVTFPTDTQWTAAWGGANNLVSLVTTKQVTQHSTWQALQISGNIFCKENGSKTEVTVTFQFAAYNGWMKRWEKLESNGAYERKIIDGINSKLPRDSSPQ